MLTWIDWVVVCAPVVLGVLGALLSIRQPSGGYKWLVGVTLVLLGITITATTLYQIRETRLADFTTHQQDEDDKAKLRAKIDDLRQGIKELEQPRLPPPHLTVSFVHPQEVAILIHNAPDVALADRPKYGVALIDLENVSADFLQIATNMGDYVRPGGSWGPNELMGIGAVKNVVKAGDRVFGSVQVGCTACGPERGYWVYLLVGQGGWYAEQHGPAKLLANLSAIQKISENFDLWVDRLVPKSERIAIE